jgi:small-conductance mechanosensitive channel/CRP-like cAMP-binding protein
VSPWAATLAEAFEDYTPYVVGLFFLLAIPVRIWAVDEHRRLKGIGLMILLHLLLVPVAGVLRAYQVGGYSEVRLLVLILGAVAVIRLISILLFVVALARIRIETPRLLREIIAASTSIVVIFALATHSGFNLSGIIATSAVLTAVVGLSLQDTLGNLMAGLALEMDRSFTVGDWIRVGDLVGKVLDIRWRSTRIETRNWETISIPNSMLVRTPFSILGKRRGSPVQQRRWIYFNVDFRYQPTDVIATVTEALTRVRIEGVAHDPPPNCIVVDLLESTARYAVRYWLTDLVRDDPTDSEIRTRLYFALKRAGIPLSIPAHAIFVTEETEERRADKAESEMRRRLEALSRAEFFHHLSEEDRRRLAKSLRYAPFAASEVMTRQGAEGHWLYIILDGEATVEVESEGFAQQVAKIGAGSFFGEMSLMTGAPRSATVRAVTDVECFRLDKGAFQELVKVRPELAEGVAEVLARRQVELAAVRSGLDAEAKARSLAERKSDLLGRIRRFFGLEDEAVG